MRTYEYIIIHCSDSEFGNRNIIDIWHKQRGWNSIGYHYVILNGFIYNITDYFNTLNGSIETGRDITKIGAHCLGYNDNSIGICMIGEGNFTDEQINNTVSFVKELQEKYNIPSEKVLGHYETEQANGKTCPNYDMNYFRSLL